MAGQVAFHLLAQAGMARAPWPVTTIVSCLPVLVLGMGTALAHMLCADANATDTPDSCTGQPAVLRSLSGPRRTRTDQTSDDRWLTGTGPEGGTRMLRSGDRSVIVGPEEMGRGPRSRRRTRPASWPSGSRRPGSPYHGGRCAAAESGAPTRH